MIFLSAHRRHRAPHPSFPVAANLATLAAVAAWSTAAIAAPPTSRLPVIDGTPDRSHEAVGALVARRTRCVETELQFLCTATLVAPRVVLTAAHCVDMLGPKGGYEVLFAPSVDEANAQASWSVVMEMKIHPDYDPNTHAWDLALLLLANPSSVTPAHLTTETMDASDVGETVTVVGFGQRTQDATSVGMRQSGTMQISDVADASFVTVPAPSMSCKGDSGGPIFRSGYVVGFLLQ